MLELCTLGLGICVITDFVHFIAVIIIIASPNHFRHWVIFIKYFVIPSLIPIIPLGIDSTQFPISIVVSNFGSTLTIYSAILCDEVSEINRKFGRKTYHLCETLFSAASSIVFRSASVTSLYMAEACSVFSA